jgi:hypothetical protein
MKTTVILLSILCVLVLLVLITLLLHPKDQKDDFEALCDKIPSPGAASEARELYALGVRPEWFTSKSQFEAMCNAPPGTQQGSPTHDQEHYSANAVQKTNPKTTGTLFPPQSIGTMHTEETHMLNELQASIDTTDVDDFASRVLHKNKAAFKTMNDYKDHKNLGVTGAVSSNRARMDSMREGFGGGASSV